MLALVVGATLLAVGGCVAFVGLVGVIRLGSSGGDEVARAEVLELDPSVPPEPGPAGEATWAAPEAGTYTVWVTGLDGAKGQAGRSLLATTCSLRQPGRDPQTVRGGRGATTTDRRVTVGSFEVAEGSAVVTCARFPVAGASPGRDFIVTEGRADGDPSVFLAVGGTFAAIAGGVLVGRSRGG